MRAARAKASCCLGALYAGMSRPVLVVQPAQLELPAIADLAVSSISGGVYSVRPIVQFQRRLLSSDGCLPTVAVH